MIQAPIKNNHDTGSEASGSLDGWKVWVEPSPKKPRRLRLCIGHETQKAFRVLGLYQRHETQKAEAKLRDWMEENKEHIAPRMVSCPCHGCSMFLTAGVPLSHDLQAIAAKERANVIFHQIVEPES